MLNNKLALILLRFLTACKTSIMQEVGRSFGPQPLTFSNIRQGGKHIEFFAYVLLFESKYSKLRENGLHSINLQQGYNHLLSFQKHIPKAYFYLYVSPVGSHVAMKFLCGDITQSVKQNQLSVAWSSWPDQ